MFSRSVMNQLNLYSLNARAFPGGEHSPASKSRRIIVSNELPVKTFQDPKTGRRSFELDSDSVYVKLRDGFEAGTEVIHVGTLTSVDVDCSDESEVEAELEKLGCVPVFLEPEKRDEESQRRAYVKANQIFANTIKSIINTDSDYVWVHDYDLMILPTLIRRKFHRVRVGFFLHSLSETSRNILSGAEILNSLLNCNLVGFSSLDNARNFLSSCTRILGRCEWSSKLGCIVLDHHGGASRSRSQTRRTGLGASTRNSLQSAIGSGGPGSGSASESWLSDRLIVLGTNNSPSSYRFSTRLQLKLSPTPD